MSNTVALECSCGTVKGELKVVKGSFFHAHCLCCDCQKMAAYLDNKENILDVHGASEIFQTYPAFMKISEGLDNIGCVQLHPKGIFRWHTTCCNMPLANTMSSSKIPFVGVSVKFMKFTNPQEKIDTLGPVTMKAFGSYSIGHMPHDAHPTFPKSYLPKIMGFMLKGFVYRKNTPSALFNGKIPLVEPKELF